jgi:hypothetical protein
LISKMAHNVLQKKNSLHSTFSYLILRISKAELINSDISTMICLMNLSKTLILMMSTVKRIKSRFLRLKRKHYSCCSILMAHKSLNPKRWLMYFKEDSYLVRTVKQKWNRMLSFYFHSTSRSLLNLYGSNIVPLKVLFGDFKWILFNKN